MDRKCLRVAALALLSMLCGKTALAARVDVYANAFLEGGWKLDVQFMDEMGSPYLLAHGMGFPLRRRVDDFVCARLGFVLFDIGAAGRK